MKISNNRTLLHHQLKSGEDKHQISLGINNLFEQAQAFTKQNSFQPALNIYRNVFEDIESTTYEKTQALFRAGQTIFQEFEASIRTNKKQAIKDFNQSFHIILSHLEKLVGNESPYIKALSIHNELVRVKFYRVFHPYKSLLSDVPIMEAKTKTEYQLHLRRLINETPDTSLQAYLAKLDSLIAFGLR